MSDQTNLAAEPTEQEAVAEVNKAGEAATSPAVPLTEAPATPNKTDSDSLTQAPKRKVPGQSWLLKTWWIMASFSLPFTLRYMYMSSYIRVPVDIDLCVRSGLVGFIAAVLIYGLWQLDRRIGKADVKDVQAEVLIRMLGMMLWLMWVGAGHLMLEANGEVTEQSAMSIPH